MASLMPFDPIREMVSLRDAVNHLFAESFVRPGFSLLSGSTLSWMKLDVYERANGYEMKALTPGLTAEDIEVTATGNTLSIKGRFPKLLSDEEAKQVIWHVHEIGSGEFVRSVTLPKPFVADQITAEVEQGVLTIWVPLAQEALPKQIPVQAVKAQPQLAHGQTVEAREPALSR
jgi:HSP20 family protein